VLGSSASATDQVIIDVILSLVVMFQGEIEEIRVRNSTRVEFLRGSPARRNSVSFQRMWSITSALAWDWVTALTGWPHISASLIAAQKTRNIPGLEQMPSLPQHIQSCEISFSRT
jgi:hypothetical protein